MYDVNEPRTDGLAGADTYVCTAGRKCRHTAWLRTWHRDTWCILLRNTTDNELFSTTLD